MAIAVTIISTLAAFGVARAQGTWTMTKLSAARSSFAAASVGNVALFAGGYTGVFIVACLMSFVCLRAVQQFGLVCPVAGFLLTCATSDVVFDAVDLYNGATGAWSTAQLSAERYALAATSVGNLALFAGGTTGGVLL